MASKQFVTTKDADEANAAKLHVQHVVEVRALIAAGDINPQEWYDAFAKAQGRDTTLSDDELVDVIADEDDNADDFNTAEGHVRLMLEAEAKQDAEGDEEDTEVVEAEGPPQGDGTKAKDVSVSGALVSGTVSPKVIEGRAMALAVKLHEDNPQANALREHVIEALNAPEITKMAAVVLLLDMKQVYPRTSNYNPIMAMPIPYSVEKPDSKNPIKCEVIDGVANPDIYKRFEKNEKGKRVKRAASFYGNMADDMMEGTIEDFAKNKAALEKAKSKKHDNSIWSQQYVGWNHHAIESELSRRQSRRTRLITMLRQAVELERMFIDVAKRLPKVVADYVTSPSDDKNVDIGFGKGRVLRRTMKPIKIYEKADSTEFDVYSVSTFLSLNVTKAVDAGGEIGDVYAAFGSGADTDEDNDAKMDIESFEELAPDFLDFVEKHKAAIYKRLNTKDSAESDDFLLTIDKIVDEMITVRDKYKVRLDRLYDNIAKAAKEASERGKTGTQG